MVDSECVRMVVHHGWLMVNDLLVFMMNFMIVNFSQLWLLNASKCIDGLMKSVLVS